jgi:hypothetical protein
MHLLIPFASTRSDACQQALATLKLPQLDKLLRQLTLTATDSAAASTLIPPHERALAAAHGLWHAQTPPDGLVPWGAWHAAQAGHPVAATDHWAVITPCHWAVQTNHITMLSPRALNLQDDESRQLLAAMQAYFAEDGITLVFDTATRWLARGAVFAGLATASPYRVLGARVDDWLPKSDAAKPLRRLQQEMQMLLYTHPLSEARAARGLLAVNSFWVSGTGATPVPATPGQSQTQTSGLVCPGTLRDAAMLDDWAAWCDAWAQIDAVQCATALQAAQRGETVVLTLCGEENALRFESTRLGPLQRLQRAIKGFSGAQVSQTVLGKL